MKTIILLFSVCLFGLLVLAPTSEGGAVKKSPPPTIVVKPFIAPPKLTAKPPKIIPFVPKTNPKKPLVDAYHLQNASGNWNMNPEQKASLDKLLAQDALNDAERQQLSELLFSGQQAGLSKEDETALSYLLLDETARSAGAVATPVATPTEDRTGPLFLRIYNNTGERLKVWVHIVPEPAEKKDDAKEEKKEEKTTEKPLIRKLETLVYVLETDKAYDLEHKGERVKATAIRVWAISPTRSWADNRDRELILTNPGNKTKTYTLTFSK